MAAATVVHDTSEAVELCNSSGLYLKPITKMIISVALPQLKQPGKSISNWEVMERLKGMVTNHQFCTLRISKSTMDFIRFEGEVDNKKLVKEFVVALDGKSIKLSGFSDILKVRAAEYKIDFPTRHDWDSFFRDAKDMNENLPGERPDTIHLEGLPCKWFAQKDSGTEKPSEEVLIKVFSTFGEIRNVDIPMLDPYREEMTGKNFHTFSFGGHLNFEAYVQYKEYIGFVKAMNALRGMKLMYKGDDGKAVACNIKVSFDSTKHLSEVSTKKRQLERQKLQELEQRREELKRKEKEAAERQKEEERQKELEELEKARKHKEKLKRKEEKQKEREIRRNKKKLQKMQAEEQKKLQEKIRLEERRLLLAQRNLQSIRLIAELLSRAMKLQEQEEEEAEKIRLLQLEERRKQQEAELRRVEEEKQRTLNLQRKERELREKLLNSLLHRNLRSVPQSKEDTKPSQFYPLQPQENIPQVALHSYVTAISTSTQTSRAPTPSGDEPLRTQSNYANTNMQGINGVFYEETPLLEYKPVNNSDKNLGKPLSSLTSILSNTSQQNNSAGKDQKCHPNESQAHQSKSELERPKGQMSYSKNSQDKIHKTKTSGKRGLSSDGGRHGKVRKTHKKHSSRDRSPDGRSYSPERSRHKNNYDKDVRDKHNHKQKRRHRRSSSRERKSWSS
ncbi:A-kinase anchor protein 17A isoform 2-T2 [Discoglossus pictus]